MSAGLIEELRQLPSKQALPQAATGARARALDDDPAGVGARLPSSPKLKLNLPARTQVSMSPDGAGERLQTSLQLGPDTPRPALPSSARLSPDRALLP